MTPEQERQQSGGRPGDRAAADRVAGASQEGRDRRTGRSAAASRIHHQASWVDLQVRQAMERGDFDDLPGAGKPIPDLGRRHDPDWWVKQLVERERITGVLPPALQLRKDDAELDDALDRLTLEREVRAEVEQFNARVVAARRQLEGGPPVVTPTRDVEATVAAWRERRDVRRRAAAEVARQDAGQDAGASGRPARRRWWRRERRHTGR